MASQTSQLPIRAAPARSAGNEDTGMAPAKEVPTIGPSILPYVKALADGSRALDETQRSELRALHAGQDGAPESGTVDLKTMLEYLTSPMGDIMAPLPANDLTRPLPEYFISSSHNTYLTGNQLYGDASTASYKDVLLRGCRCIEIDVWDGEEKKWEADGEAGEDGEKHGLRARISDAIRERRHKGDKASPTDEKEAHSADAAAMPKPWHASGSRRAEPRVLHGHTLTKEVGFRDVCDAIRETAFVNSDLPVIVSLEIHAGPEQQEMMVDIMRQTWGSMLVVPPADDPPVLPSPSELKHKILIKVKSASKAAAAQIKTSEDAPSSNTKSDSSGSEATSAAVAKNSKPVKKSKIIESLSKLGIYTRGYHFSKLDSPEAIIPSHVFSLSEKKLVQIHETCGPALFSHNMSYLMRAYPSGTRVTSTNLDPSICWRMFGVQLVALNWQHVDAGVMLNEGQFAGSGGWVLKPEGYRHASEHGLSPDKPLVVSSPQFSLQIELLSAQDLPVRDELKGERLHPYVKCEAHVGSPGERIRANEEGKLKIQEEKHKKRTKAGKGVNPDFGGDMVQFSGISTIEALSYLRFKVQNDVYGRDTLLAWACVRLDRLRTGYRFVHLLDAKGLASSAVLLVNVRKQVDA